MCLHISQWKKWKTKISRTQTLQFFIGCNQGVTNHSFNEEIWTENVIFLASADKVCVLAAHKCHISATWGLETASCHCHIYPCGSIASAEWALTQHIPGEPGPQQEHNAFFFFSGWIRIFRSHPEEMSSSFNVFHRLRYTIFTVREREKQTYGEAWTNHRSVGCWK